MNHSSHVRCGWVPADKPLYVVYHDEEWGVPVRDGKSLWAKLILDGFQAGLSWWSILSRRDGFYAAMDDMDPEVIARYSSEKVAALLTDRRIIRNRLKVQSAVTNAQAFLDMADRGEEFSTFLWTFVGGEPRVNRWEQVDDLPAATPEAEAMSTALKSRGFRFVGPTVCYAFMQAVGMVNDHTVDCFRWSEVGNT